MAVGTAAAAGRYQLLEEIARGGMGAVYRAADSILDREVAVKLLHERFAPDSAPARRFLDEARITGQLQHPAIPPVHDAGTLTDGRPFLAMKLIKGSTLEHLLEDRAGVAEDRGRFLAVFVQVCQAVGYAHARRVIHRDLKPANVMVGNFGEVQVMDWGLAKVLTEDRRGRTEHLVESTVLATEIRSARDSDVSFTQAGSILGTPAFMPPEQAGGEVEKLDERADVFGLGAILCVILTGKPPYIADTAESLRLMAIRGDLEECMARLDACGGDEELVTLCRRCLAAKPEGRPRQAGEVGGAVAGYLAGVEDRARRAEVARAGAEARAAEQSKRRRVQAVLGIALTTVVALVGFGLWWKEHQESAAAADRASRQSRTAASVSTSLDDARARTEEAWKLADDPERMRIATDMSIAALRRAEGFAESGEPSQHVLEDLVAVRASVNDLDRHTRLFVDADEALRAHDIGEDGIPDGSRTTARLADAFRRFGWDPVRTPADKIAGEIVASRVRNKMLGFLCDWEFQSSRDPKAREQVRTVIRLARLKAGGLLARLQTVLDGGKPGDLVEFTRDVDVPTLGPELLCALGRDLKRTGNQEDLLVLLRRAAERYPTHVWVNFDLMFACLGAVPPRRAEALRAISTAVASRPDGVLLQVSLAARFADFQDYDQAIAAYRKAIALSPTYLAAYSALGRLLTKTGDPDGQVTAFREASRLNPKAAFPHYGLANMLFGRGEYDAAIAEYREAIRLNPNHAFSHLGLGNALGGRRDVAGSIEAYRVALRLNPDLHHAQNFLGYALQLQGDLDGAIAAYREAVRLQPRNPAYSRNLETALRLKAEQDRKRPIAPPPRELRR